MRLPLRLITLAAITCALAHAAPQPPLKVACYARTLGARSVQKALPKKARVLATQIRDLEIETLLKYDALYIGAGSIDRPQDVKAIRTFVACGGGVMFNHSSCGRRRPETPFPNVAKKVVDRREDTIVVTKDATHPIAKELPKEIEHAYYDHLYLEPGPDGRVVVVDRAGAPVLVAGPAGAGRVVFNGAVPGYWYDAATYWQGEREPTPGELKLVANALRWAGAKRLTTLPPDVVKKRREEAELQFKLADMEKLLPTSDWFGQEMLYGAYLPARPVTELAGRFFITYDTMCWRGYALRKATRPEEIEFFRNRLRIDVHRLKWLGFTDIVLWVDVRGETVEHKTRVPDSGQKYRAIDPLAELIKAATPEGVNVWAAWHSCSRSETFARKYCAKNAKGELYKYGNRYWVEDLLSPAWRERCHRILDEYAEVYKPMGNFKGLACYDELWFTYADFHGDDLPAFDRYCREQFGEAAPDDMGRRMAKRRKWDAADVWRRRYILFKQSVITDYWRDLIDHAHSRGLQIGTQLQSSAYYSSGWTWGMDSVALARLGADFYNTSCGERPGASYPNTMRWAHAYAPWGLYNTHCLRGGPGGMYFTFNQLWRPVMYGNNLALPRELGRHIRIQRQWANGQSLAKVAFLHHQETLQMLLQDPRPVVNRAQTLLDRIQRQQDADIVFTRAHERYAQFRVLVATPYSVRGLSEQVYAKLREFVEQGGTIVSIDADWSLSRRDLTQERSVTPEMVGVTYGAPIEPAAIRLRLGDDEIKLAPKIPRRAVKLEPGTRVLSEFVNGEPAVTEKTHGKGRVVAIHFDVGAEVESTDSAEVVAYLSTLVREASTPAVVADGKGFRLISAVKKGNWVAVALYPDQVPARLTLRVDTEALGIKKKRFRMLMLGKRMEITPPGDMWGEKGFWRAEQLERGFPVTIVADHDRHMPLPETFDLSAFEAKKKGKWAAEYIRKITRDWWDSESRGKRKRTYAHEIVVLAPDDEPVMPAH